MTNWALHDYVPGTGGVALADSAHGATALAPLDTVPGTRWNDCAIVDIGVVVSVPGIESSSGVGIVRISRDRVVVLSGLQSMGSVGDVKAFDVGALRHLAWA